MSSSQDRTNITLPFVLSLAHEPDDPTCRCLAVSLLSGFAEYAVIYFDPHSLLIAIQVSWN